MADSTFKLALAGNPNSGKSTLFNLLTGLKQKVGNYPGVTVEKRTGEVGLGNGLSIELTDLPGAYGFTSRSIDEKITSDLLSASHDDAPDLVVYVADASNLKRSLFFCTQIIDRGLPVVLVLNMIDLAEKSNLEIDAEAIAKNIGVPTLIANAKNKKGIKEIKEKLAQFLSDDSSLERKTQRNENEGILERYERIDQLLVGAIQSNKTLKASGKPHPLDSILTHKVWGYLIFLLILFVIFQSIFSLAEFPMTLIEWGFEASGNFLNELLPEGALSDLLVNGVIAGLGGVIVFIPQIALLFLFVALMEESGYMARVSFIMDRLMRKLGLSGRSVIPLISGVACAVPAIMSARTIGNWKERLITIMVTPLTTCSARLPVYTLIISLIIPSQKVLGFINLQGLALLMMYLLGFVSAVLVAWVFKLVLKNRERSFFVMEMPSYKWPSASDIALTIWEKVKIFTLDVGKVIIAISIVLWALASYGPGNRFEEIEQKYNSIEYQQMEKETLEQKIASEKLEASYAGILGKQLEPVIEPLGFNWKIGIALITSFAAREVFVGTMTTIYSVGDQGQIGSLRETLSKEVNPKTGLPVYGFATGMALLLFYAFAMQCMSTIAVVFRETNHWKWPAIQLLYMSLLAYTAAFIAYQLLS